MFLTAIPMLRIGPAPSASSRRAPAIAAVRSSLAILLYRLMITATSITPRSYRIHNIGMLKRLWTTGLVVGFCVLGIADRVGAAGFYSNAHLICTVGQGFCCNSIWEKQSTIACSEKI